MKQMRIEIIKKTANSETVEKTVYISKLLELETILTREVFACHFRFVLPFYVPKFLGLILIRSDNRREYAPYQF